MDPIGSLLGTNKDPGGWDSSAFTAPVSVTCVLSLHVLPQRLPLTRDISLFPRSLESQKSAQHVSVTRASGRYLFGCSAMAVFRGGAVAGRKDVNEVRERRGFLASSLSWVLLYSTYCAFDRPIWETL